MKTDQPWTKEEDALLAELIKKRKSFAQAGLEIGRTKNSCISRARRIGVKTENRPSIWRTGERAHKKAKQICKNWALSWDSASISMVRKLRAEGRTAHEIAIEMQRPYSGVRYVFRKFNVAPPPDQQARIQRRIAAKEASEPELLPIEVVFERPGLSLIDLTPDQCKWPVTDDAPFRFCGAKRDHAVYCDMHHLLAYNARKATPQERSKVEASMRAVLVGGRR